jgi:signal transduction histidine kinase
MVENSASPLSAVSETPKSRWHRALFSVRTRLLLWYVLLACGTAAISITSANRIYSDATVASARSAIKQQMDQFQLYVAKKKIHNELPNDTAELFDGFLSSYAPTKNEYVVTLINGQPYRHDSAMPQLPAAIQNNPELWRQWSQVRSRQIDQIYTDQQQLQSIVEPFQILGSQPGSIVILYDHTSDFLFKREAFKRLLRDVLIFLTISCILAWITAGRVLLPLRLVTQTAHSITESDMTQRIPVRGSDEIAELAITFNEMLDRLQTAFNSQKEFLKDASHELRTPITIIRGHLEMLQYRPERQAETTVLLLDELERMSRLVNDLLLLAKTDHPDFLHIRTEELDLLTEELYSKACSFGDRQWQLESKGISPIPLDRQRITQAVMNLVQNATHHTQPTDTIAIGSAVRDTEAHLWVKDTGTGISPEQQQRIFDRFTRGTPAHQPNDGHGLGLSIVQAIAQAHGGRVELVSRLGQGSTFTIVIPLESPHVNYESDSHRRRQSPHQFFSGNRTPVERLHDADR